MKTQERYQSAKEIYAAQGVDTDAVLAQLKDVAISMHCWQGDDVTALTRKVLYQEEFRPLETIPEKHGRQKS